MARYRLVKEDELLHLLEQNFRLIALENGGVDNWEWYGESLGDFLSEWVRRKKVDPTDDWTFEDIAEEDLMDYEIYEN